MSKIHINRRDFYKNSSLELVNRTRDRLTQISEMGMEHFGNAKFGFSGTTSELWLNIEDVWSYSDEEWNHHMKWANKLKIKLVQKNPTQTAETKWTERLNIMKANYSKEMDSLSDSESSLFQEMISNVAAMITDFRSETIAKQQDGSFTLDEMEQSFNEGYMLPLLPVNEVRPKFNEFIKELSRRKERLALQDAGREIALTV